MRFVYWECAAQEPSLLCQLYKRLGPCMVAKLRGDFAFVLHDSVMVRPYFPNGPCPILLTCDCLSQQSAGSRGVLLTGKADGTSWMSCAESDAGSTIRGVQRAAGVCSDSGWQPGSGGGCPRAAEHRGVPARREAAGKLAQPDSCAQRVIHTCRQWPRAAIRDIY